jgi:hypothetical protein
MNGSEGEPSKSHRKFYLGVGAVALMLVVFAVALFAFRDPALYSNAIKVQTVTDKQSYTRGEDVSISVYVINGKGESFVQPTTVSYKVSDSTGQEVYAVILDITWPFPPPEFPAHSKTLFSSHVWNQKSISTAAIVEPGNYTITVSLEYGTSESNIEIVKTQ